MNCRVQTTAGLVIAPRLDLLDACELAKVRAILDGGVLLVIRNDDNEALLVASTDNEAQVRVHRQVQQPDPHKAKPVIAPAVPDGKCVHAWKKRPVDGRYRCSRCRAWGWRRGEALLGKRYPVTPFVCRVSSCRRTAVHCTGATLGRTHFYWCDVHAEEAGDDAAE